MVMVEIEDTFIITGIKSIIIYGKVTGDRPIKVGDKLHEYNNDLNVFEVHDFPLIRRSNKYKDNFIDIGIIPVSGSVDNHDKSKIAQGLKGKRMIVE